jgi:flagellar protein FlaF
MSIQAYQRTAQKTENPRQIEYRVFADVTRSLIAAKDLPPHEIGQRAEALSRNRQLWGILAADCASDGNQLPKPMRAQIISLSLFIGRHTSVAIDDADAIDVLVDINRTIMQGLSPGSAAP